MWAHHSGAACVQLVVSDESVLRPLQDRLTIPLIAGQAEIALYPFSLEQTRPIFDAPIVAGCFRNIYSYRKLLHPSQAAYSLPRLTADLRRQGYRLEKLAGIYPPAFLFWWTLGVAAGARFPAQHFEWEQTAMNHLSTTRQPDMTFSHILVFYARRLVS
jgi:hypothetical protein